MKEEKLNKLMLRKSALQQKSEEFKSKYGTRNAKLTAAQLKAKEVLKDKYEINNAKIAEKKAELKKMMTIVKKKGGANPSFTTWTNTSPPHMQHRHEHSSNNNFIEELKKYQDIEFFFNHLHIYLDDDNYKNLVGDVPKSFNCEPNHILFQLRNYLGTDIYLIAPVSLASPSPTPVTRTPLTTTVVYCLMRLFVL
jgi:hypothetical protein